MLNTKLETINSCTRKLDIEISGDEVKQKFDQVYADIAKGARIPGFRPGRAPRDLLESHYGKMAEEELIRRSVPEYCLIAIKQEKLVPVASPEIEDIRFKNHTLYFTAKVEVKPQIKLKGYTGLKIIKKKVELKARQVKAELNKDLQANAEAMIQSDMDRQLLEQLLIRATLDVPQSLVADQTIELLNQMKLNRLLQGEKKEDIQAKEKEIENEARKEAVRRVKLSFILEEIAQRENIQVEQKEIDARIAEIAQRSGRAEDEISQYLDKHELFDGLKAELQNKKTLEFLLKEAKITEE